MADMTDATGVDDLDPPRARVSGIAVSYALFGGIFAWMAHLIGQSALTGYVCETGELWPMHAITVATAAATAHALWVGWRIAKATDPSPNLQAARLLGWLAVFFNIFNIILIVGEWVPVLYLNPCAVG